MHLQTVIEALFPTSDYFKMQNFMCRYTSLVIWSDYLNSVLSVAISF